MTAVSERSTVPTPVGRNCHGSEYLGFAGLADSEIAGEGCSGVAAASADA
ncbi:MAG: hypothetical protein R3B13_05730 [Polyangiaceae bacterium]